jgi:hypothetical protein
VHELPDRISGPSEHAVVLALGMSVGVGHELSSQANVNGVNLVALQCKTSGLGEYPGSQLPVQIEPDWITLPSRQVPFTMPMVLGAMHGRGMQEYDKGDNSPKRHDKAGGSVLYPGAQRV